MNATDRDRIMSRMPRGRALVLLLVVLAVALVAVPAYVATRDSYLERVPGYGGLSKAWSASTHADASCEQCHVRPGAIARASYGLRMTGAFYRRLVQPSSRPAMDRPTNAACLVCHSDLRTVSPDGDLQIPHRAHVEILKMRCVECHDNLVHESGSDATYAPKMETCLTCHDGDTAKDSCSACHTQKAAPASHASRAWLVDHAAQADSPSCPTCHKWAEKWCSDCHSQRPVSHGKEWRAEHGRAVEVRRNCEACHRTEFCVRCHGENPRENYDPALRLVE